MSSQSGEDAERSAPFTAIRASSYALLAHVMWSKANRMVPTFKLEEEELLTHMGLSLSDVLEFTEIDGDIPLARTCKEGTAARVTYPKLLQDFYRNYGFESAELPPDHPASMLAFMARLILEESRSGAQAQLAMRRVEHRFIKAHLLEALRCLHGRLACSLTRKLVQIIEEDAKALYKLLVGGAQEGPRLHRYRFT